MSERHIGKAMTVENVCMEKSTLTLNDIRSAVSLIAKPPLHEGDIVIVSLDDWAVNTEAVEELLSICGQYGANMFWGENVEMGDLRIMKRPELKFELPIEYEFKTNETILQIDSWFTSDWPI